MMKIPLAAILVFSVLNTYSQKDYSRLVNPFIGTGGHGHTFPGATMPHGMVQLSPDTRLDGWDGCGGYHYSDSFIYGFSHTHLSGTGVSDYGDILIMPGNGKPSPDNKIYGSSFSHKNESAHAGSYQVTLADDNIRAELTATARTGIHRYTYSTSADNNLVIDLFHRDEVIGSSIKFEDSITVTGMRRSRAWATDQYVYFVMKLSQPMAASGIWESNKELSPGIKEFAGSKNLKAWMKFNLASDNQLMVKVAISAVSIEGARANMEHEIPGWDFEKVLNNARAEWNKELSKIEIETDDKTVERIFYTALYHTAIVPNINMDVDGQYRGRDLKIHQANDFTNYSVFSLWDTYRGAHPLYTIIDQQRTTDYIKTFLTQYQQGGRLPVWELASCETECMIGYHSVPVIYDAYSKGIKGFDHSLALKAMQHSATMNHFGLPSYMMNGVITMNDEHESVSKTLEYAYDDWCIAMFAKSLREAEIYKQFIRRSQYYKNTFDPRTGFMRPLKNGDWLKPFDPREVNNNFTEANSWQYSFYMPHDIQGYIQLIGGVKKFENQLNGLFSAPSQTTGRDQSDITGLIGQYAHGNEPSHHIIYLYNYTSTPYKTQQLVSKVMREFYLDSPDGLIGNEDCGQMSAWYILSALGFYPVTPGSGYYEIGSPLVKRATINLENGKKFIITREGEERSIFIDHIELNGKPHNKLSLDHSVLMKGGQIKFSMSDKPSTTFAKLSPTSISQEDRIVINPVIEGGGISFTGKKKISMYSAQGLPVHYTTDGTEPGINSMKYSKPFFIQSSQIIKAKTIGPGGTESFTVTAEYKKRPHSWTLKLLQPYEKQYQGGSDDALIDGLYASTDWRKGGWQGFQKNDMEIVIDMKEMRQVDSVVINFLQDAGAWIVMPKHVFVSYSLDGKSFSNTQSYISDLPLEDSKLQTRKAGVKLQTKTRFIKILAKQYGKLPSWHTGAGGDTHIFADEVIIK